MWHEHVRAGSIVPPSDLIEAGFYAYLAYASLGSMVGFEVPLLGIGSLLVLATLCTVRHGVRIDDLLRLVALPLACALSLGAVQMLVHHQSLTSEYVKDIPAWILSLVILHSLCLRRGFLQRFPLVMFLIGLAALGGLRSTGWEIVTEAGDDVVRASGAGPLRNSNGMAFWFGFCFVYFVVIGLETRRLTVRLSSWTMALVCLGLVGITVSRGTLLAMAVAAIIALRRLLKRGFLPLLILLAGIWGVVLLGLFDTIAAFYTARGLEETGRLSVWPLVIERILSWPAWLHGVPVAEFGTWLPDSDRIVSPHNTFLFMGLAGGIVPFLLYAAYCQRAARGVWLGYRTNHPDAVFIAPFFVLVFLTAQATNFQVVEFPMIVTFAAALGMAHQPARLQVSRRRGQPQPAPLGRFRPVPSQSPLSR